MLFNDKVELCYIKITDVFSWTKENKFDEKNFLREKQKWEKKVSKEPNFFSDTELLILDKDIIVLKVLDENHISFLAKTYKLEYQSICQKLFQEKKNIIIISQGEWREPKNDKKVIVLFKDKENIETSLQKWLAK